MDEIRLTIPARPAYVRLARLAGAAIASRLGFSYDDVEDLRIAVDELCLLLVGGPGSMTLRFTTPSATTMVVTGEGPGAAAVSELSRQILTAIVDTYEVTEDGGITRFTMRQTKRA